MSDEQTEQLETPAGEAAPGFEAAQKVGGSLASMIGAKNLIIAIVAMPFVFLAVVMLVIGVAGKSSDKAEQQAAVAPGESASAPASGPTPGVVVSTLVEPSVAKDLLTEPNRVIAPMAASAGFGTLSPSIELPDGAAPGDIALDGDRLAVRVDSDYGSMIMVYDLNAGRVLNTVPLVSAKPASRAAAAPGGKSTEFVEIIEAAPIVESTTTVTEVIVEKVEEEARPVKIAPAPSLSPRRTKYVTTPQ